MIARCPVCGADNDSEAHDVGWYFVCNGLCPVRLVWVEDPDGVLELWPVQDDLDEMERGRR